jgi:hypothetical protein
MIDGLRSVPLLAHVLIVDRVKTLSYFVMSRQRGSHQMAVWQCFESIVLKAETEHLSGRAEAKKVKSFCL